MTSKKKDNKDPKNQVETTGHEWDGIEELNNPLPRWWLWVFYVTVIWSIGYWVIYPAWPVFHADGERGGTKGMWEWTQYRKLEEEQEEIQQRRQTYLQRFHKASFDEIINDPTLYTFAIAGGKAAFKDNCATCHGSGGAGAKSYPNLNDDDWIWGGDLENIYLTIKYGVRIHEEGRQSEMPSYAGVLTKEQIRSIAHYVQAMHPQQKTAELISVSNISLGKQLYQENCASCHREDGTGDREIGAPNLADAIWLKSEDGSLEAIIQQMTAPRHGMMPAWVDRLDEDSIRQLTIYVHSLGGGE